MSSQVPSQSQFLLPARDEEAEEALRELFEMDAQADAPQAIPAASKPAAEQQPRPSQAPGLHSSLPQQALPQHTVHVKPSIAPKAVQSPGAQQPAVPAGTAAAPHAVSRVEVTTAVRHVLQGKSWPDLERMNLKVLRGLVVGHLGLGRQERRALADSRRHEFQEIAAEVIQDLKQTLTADVDTRPGWLQVLEDEEALTAVYLVTFASIIPDTAANAQEPLKTLDGVSRVAIRDAVLDAIANPVDMRRGGRPCNDKAEADRMAVFLETPLHFHVALRLSRRTVFMPYKLALRQRSGLASHWSCTHTEFCSAVRYGYFTTDHKPEVDMKPLGWSIGGEGFNFYDESLENWNAAAYRKKRENAAAGRAPGAQVDRKRQKKAGTTFRKLDFNALVMDESLTTPCAVLAHAQATGDEGLMHFVSNNQDKLETYIQHAAQWANAAESAQTEKQSDWQLVQQRAGEKCNCPGGLCQWWHAADDFLIRNAATIDRGELAAALANVIRFGPGKTTRVPLIAGVSNAAKTLMFQPIVPLFGFRNVVHRPAERATMALANVALKGKRFIFWDENRPIEYAARGTVPVGTFLSLMGGTALEAQVSQSFQNGNAELEWKRGVAMTAKADGLWDPIPPLPGLVPVTKEDIGHMQNRVLQFNALVAVKGADLVNVPACHQSFCRWLVCEAGTFANKHIERPMRTLEGRALPALPDQQPTNKDDDED